MLSESDKLEIKKIVKQMRCCTTKWTSESRPYHPHVGLMGYNITEDKYEYWNGNTWVSLSVDTVE